MLHLLRNIHRKLLSQDNKVLSYSLYAIGEIFLVVVGILIAVQIDDWSEERKLKKKEDEYYCKLLEDLQQDQDQIARLIGETEIRLMHANHLLHFLQLPTLDPDTISKEMMLANSLVTFTFKPSTAAFDDLKSSGNLRLIDETIAKKLRQYYANVEGIVDVVDINSDHAVRLFQQTDNYAKIGWQKIEIADTAIDSAIVNKQQLYDLIQPDEKYREELTSDAVYYLSASARVRMLYQNLKKEIDLMANSLTEKCQTQNRKN